MEDLTVKIGVNVPVTTLIADMQVRYWEDARVNGVDEDDADPKMPFRSGDLWKLQIDLQSGMIRGWPRGTTADTHYKVCDAGVYGLAGANGNSVVVKDGYVPSMLSPGGDGYGDYVIMKIDEYGRIDNWSPDLSYFEDQE